MRFAAVEGGGTTWVCAIAVDRPDNFLERKEFETKDPITTLTSIKEWLLTKEFDSIGIASFGPIDAKVNSIKYGYITSTPKPGWQNTNVIKLLGLYDEFKNIPFLFDTDVNAPALAEFNLHGDSTKTSCAYITVGTGIGVGLVINNQSVKGLLHPEAGHILVKRKPNDLMIGDNIFLGTCPYHKDCIEGMCSSGALALRANCSIQELPLLTDDHEIWDITAYYIAQLCVNLILIASPELICIGGGVLNRKSLFPKIRSYTLSILSDYVQHELLTEDEIQNYIKPSYWGKDAGIVGAAYLALLAFPNKRL